MIHLTYISLVIATVANALLMSVNVLKNLLQSTSMKKLLFLLLFLPVLTFGQENTISKTGFFNIQVTDSVGMKDRELPNSAWVKAYVSNYFLRKTATASNSLLLAGKDTNYWKSLLHSPVTLNTANGLSLTGQQLSLGLSTGSTNGALSSTDWNTFNNKVSFPGFGTTGTTAAYGNHNHTGVYQPSGSYLTAESDPVFNASAAKNITSGNITTWNSLVTFPGFGTSNTTASRGDHNHTGTYLTSESDPVYAATAASGITAGNITNWNSAYTNIHNAVNIGTANGLYFTTNQTTQIINMGLSSSSTTGALTSADWTTFNNKEPAIASGTVTDYVTGAKTIRSFPIKFLQVSISNSSLRTNSSSTQLLANFPSFSTIIGAYIVFNESLTSISFTGNIKASTGNPYMNLNEINTTGPVQYTFVKPNSSDWVASNSAIYFNVTNTTIASTTVTATVTLIYFDSINYY